MKIQKRTQSVYGLRLTLVVALLSVASGLSDCYVHVQYHEFNIPESRVVLTDDTSIIRDACRNVLTAGTIVGCYVPATRTMYARPDDSLTVYHELLHAAGLSHEQMDAVLPSHLR